MKLSYKKLIPLILIFIVLGLFLVNVNEAKAASLIASILSGVGEDIVMIMAWVGLKINGYFVTICALILEGVLNFGFMSLEGVEMGWTICRDVVNMFFILGLVVIAFATILRFETYGMKVLLPKLIIIAILINFSFLICGVIIDASQIIADYFLDKIKAGGSIGIKLLASLRISSSFNPGEGSTVFESINAIDNFLRFILSTIFLNVVLMVTWVALIVGAILLLIRIGALWILMILAPFAWFFSIFPGLKAMSKKWWDNFLKYAFFAPIYVFFIYLIISISPVIFSQSKTVLGNVDETFLKNLESFAITQMAGSANLIFGFVFVIMLLLGAPVIATSMGLQATNAVTKGYQGIIRGVTGLPLKGLKYAVKSGLQKFDRDVLGPRGLSIRDALKAWGLRKTRIEEEKRKVPTGEWYDRLNLWFGEGKTFYAERARDELRQEEQLRIKKQDLSLESLGDRMYEAKKAIDAGKIHLVHQFQAALFEAVNRADEEGAMGHPLLGEKYKHIAGIENYQQLIKDTIPDEEEAIRFAGQLGALAKLRGIHYLDGMTKYDKDQEKMVWTPKDELGEKGAMELSKLSARYIWQNSNRRNFATMNTGPAHEYIDSETGKPVIDKKTGQPMIIKTGDAEMPSKLLESLLKRTRFDPNHLTQFFQYTAPETVHYLGQEPIMREIRKLVNQVKAENPTAEKWLAELEAKNKGEKSPSAPGGGRKEPKEEGPK